MRKTDRFRQGSPFQQRGYQRAVKGIAGSDSINGLHTKTRDPTTFAFGTEPDAAAAEGDHHRTNAFGMQHVGGFCRILVALNANTGQLFRFGFVGGNDIHQRQQFIGQFTRWRGIKHHGGLMAMGDFRRRQHALQRRLQLH